MAYFDYDILYGNVYLYQSALKVKLKLHICIQDRQGIRCRESFTDCDEIYNPNSEVNNNTQVERYEKWNIISAVAAVALKVVRCDDVHVTMLMSLQTMLMRLWTML